MLLTTMAAVLHVQRQVGLLEVALSQTQAAYSHNRHSEVKGHHPAAGTLPRLKEVEKWGEGVRV